MKKARKECIEIRLNEQLETAARAIGIHIPKIMLPNDQVDLKKWAVVACDQYTSQRSYWQAVEKEVGSSPSALHIIFPEVYLEDDDKEQRITNIINTMAVYLDENKPVLKQLPPSFVYVERTISTGVRRGLLTALDLEKYDYSQGSQSLIRATEGTVLDRLPPRIAIRKDALLETPHIMVLIDDPEKTVIEPIRDDLREEDKLYDFDLMKNGGHIRGYQVTASKTVEKIIKALTKLADPEVFQQKYHVGEDKSVLLFAMGDGNHSLATAKACWEQIKGGLSEDEKEDHPARYALVELVNVHDESLVFEPIHRLLFNVKVNELLDYMSTYYRSTGQDFACEKFDTYEEMQERYEICLQNMDNDHLIPYIAKGEWGILRITNPKNNLEAGTLQAFLDDFLSRNKKAAIDYIHGREVLTELGTQEGNIGFCLPNMSKHDLFRTVILDGVLPRKTFSMGEAHEKRFYLECRKIVK